MAGATIPNYKELYMEASTRASEINRKYNELLEIVRKLRITEEQLQNCDNEKTVLENSRTSLLKEAAML